MCDSLPTYEEAIANGGRSRGKKQPAKKPAKPAKPVKKVTRKQVDSESDCDCSDCCEESSSSCGCSDCEVDIRKSRQPQRRKATQKRQTKPRGNCDDGSCDIQRRAPPKRKNQTNCCCGYSCR